ncbi:MAG: hypothetical protein C4584_02000 [Armatimonadetes bacterium]|nr:MAG: hypothetical protein C4584_02000 [Armatimonadota bacterium]
MIEVKDRPDCTKCDDFDSRYPESCPFGPVGSTKVLGDICPKELGLEKIKEKCWYYPDCLKDEHIWQSKRLWGSDGCSVEKLEDLRFCFGYTLK